MNEEVVQKKSSGKIVYIIIIVILLAVIGGLVYINLDKDKKSDDVVEETNNTEVNEKEYIESKKEATASYRKMIDKYPVNRVHIMGSADIQLKAEMVFNALEPDSKVLCEEAFGKDDNLSGTYACKDTRTHDAYKASAVIAKYKELFEDSTELEAIIASNLPYVYNYRYSSILDSFVDPTPSITLGDDGIYRYDDGTEIELTTGNKIYKVASAVGHDDIEEVTIEVLSYMKTQNGYVYYAYENINSSSTTSYPIDDFSEEKLEKLLYTGNLILPKFKYTFRVPSGSEGTHVDFEDYILVSIESVK